MHCKLQTFQNVTNTYIIASFQTHAVLARARAAALTIEKVFLRVVSHHSNSDDISPSLTLMSPSNFYKTHAFLRVTNACHCLVSDDDLRQHTTYRISFSPLLSHQTYPKAARLASLLPQSPLHTPPCIRGTADSQAAGHVFCAATPARKRDTRLAAAGFRPPLLRHILYI